MEPGGKVVLVTGGTRGAGLAIARALAAEGFRVVLAARDWDRLIAVREEIASSGADELLAVPCDVEEQGDVANLVDKAAERFGGIDCLVQAAGSDRGRARVTEAVRPYLAGRGGGPVLHVRRCLSAGEAARECVRVLAAWAGTGVVEIDISSSFSPPASSLQPPA
ncbi:MAG: SDR family NAD(P)-dependent oxidoreductase [Planctomycetes bacterium]|nr:SDR family NAD(P)-dependent oxidoreductase [Planctomycetota bacterium]